MEGSVGCYLGGGFGLVKVEGVAGLEEACFQEIAEWNLGLVAFAPCSKCGMVKRHGHYRIYPLLGNAHVFGVALEANPVTMQFLGYRACGLITLTNLPAAYAST